MVPYSQCMALVSYTSNTAHNDIGNHLRLYVLGVSVSVALDKASPIVSPGRTGHLGHKQGFQGTEGST